MTLLALLSISLLLFSFTTENNAQTQAQCHSDQHHALIQLKQGFNTTELHSWNASTNCCIWDGIKCDERTGMVTTLNLAKRSISGEINPSLFNLSSLRYLNLAHNNFYNIQLPQTGFERLGNLTHLIISFSGFVGQVPIGISTLTNLISLELEANDLLYLHDTGLKTLLSNLTKLEVLCLDGVDISLNGSEWSNAIFQVGPSLQKLSMAICGLSGNFPDEIFHITNLTELDLSFNFMLSGQLPEFTKQSILQYISFEGTNFTGPLPGSIGNLQYLSSLVLSGCNFYGEVPPSITNLTRLQFLNLQSNRLRGTIPMPLFSHPSLLFLGLRNNHLSGYLHEFSNGSSILEIIYLAYNNLQGQLPISIFKSSQLIILDLESNNFTGTLDLDIIKHNKNLSSLFLSNNKLSIREEKIHNESFYASFPQIYFLSLSSCNLTNFPTFLSYQTSIGILDLSYNKIEGVIPNWLCTRKSIYTLDLSHNFFTKIEGDAHFTSLSSLLVLDIHSNRISGPVPLLPLGIQYADFSSNIFFSLPAYFSSNCDNLEVLDLGNNEIVSRFPFWLRHLKSLTVLILRSNKFYGTISNMEATRKKQNSSFRKIRVFDLSSNHFRGIIPKNIFDNMKAMVTNSDSGEHYWNSYYYQNSITTIWKGQEMEIRKSLIIFSSLDLSQNKFCGEIPQEIGQLKLLDVLNLSHNALTGPIPSEFANIHQLQSLDLSSNQLYGQIPQELTSLTFLSVLNLSYNNLVGEIPKAHQFNTFPNTSYLGNTGLCGDPLSMQCAKPPSNRVFIKGLPSKSPSDIIELSVSIGLGLGVGFASVIWAMVSWENGKKWFNFIIDRFYFRHFH